MNTIPASGSTPVTEEGSNTPMANHQEVQRPCTLPVLGTGPPLLGPTQPQDYEAAGPPRFDIDQFFDFDRDLGSGLAGHSLPCGGADYGVRDGASLEILRSGTRSTVSPSQTSSCLAVRSISVAVEGIRFVQAS
jgi:hypothetical protein